MNDLREISSLWLITGDGRGILISIIMIIPSKDSFWSPV